MFFLSLRQPLTLFNVFANSSVDYLLRQSDRTIHSFKSSNIRGDPPFLPVSLGASVAIVLYTHSSAIADMQVGVDTDLIVCLPLNMNCINAE